MFPSTTIRYAKSGLANALLVTISILVTYAVAELIFFRLVLPYMSLNLLPHLPDRAAFFLQSSKTEYVPRDYIALIGDSNAQGMGDWLLKTAGDLAKPHHSADVLHQVLGTDVVTLGRAASGSAEALEPIQEVVESDESVVILCWAFDSRGGAPDVEAGTSHCCGPHRSSLSE